MRMTAPVIGGAAIGLALALVWWFRPQSEASLDSDAAEVPTPARRVADAAPSIAVRDPSIDARGLVDVPITLPAASLERAPLPGEMPVTPIAQMLAERQQNLIVRDAPGGGPPAELVEGEREFAVEPIDATWAPGAEAALLAKFAQMPGLKAIDLQVECRSTMCRFQLTQPNGSAAQGSPQVPLDVFREELGLTPRWIMAVVDRPGSPIGKSIAYLWRDGFAPKPESGAHQ
jgi:hypothetical protein